MAVPPPLRRHPHRVLRAADEVLPPGRLRPGLPHRPRQRALVVTVLAAVFAHEVPDAWAAAGIALSCAGLTGVALWGLRGRRPDWAAIGAALATGLTIAVYTVVDGLGVRASESSLGYIAWLMVLQGTIIPAYAIRRWRRQTLTQLLPSAPSASSAPPCPYRRTPWSCGHRPGPPSHRSPPYGNRRSSFAHTVIASLVMGLGKVTPTAASSLAARPRCGVRQHRNQDPPRRGRDALRQSDNGLQ